MSHNKLPIAIIVGSNRQGRIGGRIGDWVNEAAHEAGHFDIDLIDVATNALPPDYPDQPDAATLALRRRIASAAGFVVVTPEYNHSFPAPLKHLIDQAYEEWRAKPVAFVSYGGVSGGLRAVEALRLVFAELQAVTLRDGVSFPQAWTSFEADEPARIGAAVSQAARVMFGQLAWWSTALERARIELALDDFLPRRAAD